MDLSARLSQGQVREAYKIIEIDISICLMWNKRVEKADKADETVNFICFNHERNPVESNSPKTFTDSTGFPYESC